MVSCWWPDSCGGEDPGGGDGGGNCSFGSCNEDPPSGGHPDTCSTFCGPAGDFGFPAPPNANGFIATAPGIDWLNVLFGSPDPSMVIFNWHIDPITGAVVPDNGDKSCGDGSEGSGNCQYWNSDLWAWTPTPPPTPDQKRLNALKRAGNMASPVTKPGVIGCFYAASAIAGALGGLAPGGAVRAIARETAQEVTTMPGYPTLYNWFVNPLKPRPTVLQSLTAIGSRLGVTQWIGNQASRLGQEIANTCNGS
jgi:hypothetical protein